MSARIHRKPPDVLGAKDRAHRNAGTHPVHLHLTAQDPSDPHLTAPVSSGPHLIARGPSTRPPHRRPTNHPTTAQNHPAIHTRQASPPAQPPHRRRAPAAPIPHRRQAAAPNLPTAQDHSPDLVHPGASPLKRTAEGEQAPRSSPYRIRPSLPQSALTFAATDSAPHIQHLGAAATGRTAQPLSRVPVTVSPQP